MHIMVERADRSAEDLSSLFFVSPYFFLYLLTNIVLEKKTYVIINFLKQKHFQL